MAGKRSAGRDLEAEVTRLIAYLNDHVVPEVRRSSSVGLRAAAEQLHRMAEHLDRSATRADREAERPETPAAPSSHP